MTDEQRDAIREELAAYAHEAWSGWMKYMLPKLTAAIDLGLNELATDPDFKYEYETTMYSVQRWRRQADTPYADLPESEKESDRTEADRMLAIFEADR